MFSRALDNLLYALRRLVVLHVKDGIEDLAESPRTGPLFHWDARAYEKGCREAEARVPSACCEEVKGEEEEAREDVVQRAEETHEDPCEGFARCRREGEEVGHLKGARIELYLRRW